MDHDLLLRWCSERSSGSLRTFKEAHQWLQELGSGQSVASRQIALVPRRDRWTWSLQSLQALGHVEVDWPTRRWSAAPPVVTTLTDGGGFALLCGARPGALLRRLDGLLRDPDERLRDLAANVVFDLPVPQHGGPALRLLQAPDTHDAQELCALLGIEFVDRAADRLLRVLPRLNELLMPGVRRDLPGGVAPARMTGPPPRLFVDLDHDTGEPGAYEVRLYDAPRYFYRHSPARVYEGERGAVVYAELRRTDRQVLRYDPSSQTLLVSPWLRLPSLYERAATLRSGLLPHLEEDPRTMGEESARTRSTRMLRYVNIDLPFAERLAELLGQRLNSSRAPAVAGLRSPASRAVQYPQSVRRQTLERR
jgi:hypothetical protein